MFSDSLLYPTICEHTTFEKDGRRHPSPLHHRFLHRGVYVTISLEPMSVYEVHIPRLQILDTAPSLTSPATSSVPHFEEAGSENERLADARRREKLQLEIAAWFGHAKRWCNTLETHLRDQKRLPRRPDSQSNDDMHAKSLLASASFVRSRLSSTASVHHPSLARDLSAVSTILQNLRGEEVLLYGDLKPSSTVPINDIRRRFASMAKNFKDRMTPLEQRFGPDIGGCIWEEPPWSSKDNLVLPGSWIVVKEDEIGSIISYTIR